ncbi:MAG: endonuclease/exonuclease/phosphatase family protein [Myxococcota bacterium]|nr:endonuclease/exonuclease/phosphatase family protein [Myxococcota bacterium]
MRQARQLAGFFVLLIGLLCSGGLAGLCPEDVLWLSALRAVLLSLPRPMMFLFVLWGIWFWRRTRSRGGLVVAGVALLLAGIPPLWPAPREGLLLVSANVQAYADESEALEQSLGALGADIVLTHEQRGERIPGMSRVADNYDRGLPKPSHGEAVYCARHLFCDAEITEEYGAPGCGMPVALARVEASLCVIGIHAPPPIPICSSGMGPYLETVGSHIEGGRMASDWGPCKADDPVVVAGDLNYVPGSRAWRGLVDRGLEDPVAWQGVWANSWPAGGGWPMAPFFRLDHLLAGDVRVRGVRYLRLPGADHRAIRARIQMED